MNDRMVELIAIGAAYAANCEACFAYHVKEAARLGIDTEDVIAAIEIGGVVKNASRTRIDHLAERMVGHEPEHQHLHTHEHEKAAQGQIGLCACLLPILL